MCQITIAALHTEIMSDLMIIMDHANCTLQSMQPTLIWELMRNYVPVMVSDEKACHCSIGSFVHFRVCVWGLERTYITSDPHVRNVESVLTVPLQLSNFKLLPLHFFTLHLSCILPYHLLIYRMHAVFDWKTGRMLSDHCVLILFSGRVSRRSIIHWLVSYPPTMQ
jgi:hypothetical protein